jgi:hypothetical protein
MERAGTLRYRPSALALLRVEQPDLYNLLRIGKMGLTSIESRHPGTISGILSSLRLLRPPGNPLRSYFPLAPGARLRHVSATIWNLSRRDVQEIGEHL